MVSFVHPAVSIIQMISVISVKQKQQANFCSPRVPCGGSIWCWATMQ